MDIKRLKILVVDDTERHRKSAVKTLTGHDLTVVSSFDEAMDLLVINVNDEEVKEMVCQKLIKAGCEDEIESCGYYDSDYPWRGRKWRRTIAKVSQRMRQPTFDVVLTELSLPASKRDILPFVDTPDQIPYGLVIALRAAMTGIKFVAVVAGMDERYGADSASLNYLKRDSIGYMDCMVSGARVDFIQCEDWVEKYRRVGKERIETGLRSCPKCGGRIYGCKLCQGTGEVLRTKDWGMILARLIN